VEEKKRILSKVRPKIKKLCIVWDCANMEALLATILEEEKVLQELRKTPFDPLKEQKEFMNVANAMVEKHTQVLGNVLVNFFKR
jgi:hypothetical protein